jgi:hypothetical protein
VLAGYDEFVLNRPTPLFEGELDRPLFDTAETERIWLARRAEDGQITLEAGRLHGLTEGSVIALLPFDGGSETPLAEAEVVENGLARSRLKLLDEAALSTLPERMAAQLVAKAVFFGLVISQPRGEDPFATGSDLDHTRAALKVLAGNDNVYNLNLSVVPAEAAADVYLRVVEGRLWLLPASGRWVRQGREQTPSIELKGTPTETAGALATALERIAKVKNLLALAAELDEGIVGESLHVETYILRDESEVPSDRRACPPVAQGVVSSGAVLLDRIETPEIFHCDALYLSRENLGKNPVDLTVLFLDSEGGIAVPSEVRGGVRLLPGEPPIIYAFRVATWDPRRDQPLSIGLERLVIIAVESQGRADLTQPINFDHLAQPSLESLRSGEPSRNAAVAQLAALLEDAAYSRTRSRTIEAGGDFEKATMQVIRWNTRPLQE